VALDFSFKMASSSRSFNQTLEVTITSLNRATISVRESAAPEAAPALEINSEPEAPRSFAWYITSEFSIICEVE